MASRGTPPGGLLGVTAGRPFGGAAATPASSHRVRRIHGIVDRAMSADAKIHSASPRCDVPCEAEPNSNLGRALWSARNRSNLPMSDAATDMKQHTYTPRLHESHQVLANNRKKHRRDGYDLPPRAIRPEVKPGLTSQEVGWHVGTHPCKGPDHPHIQSPMSLFRHEMMHTGQTSVLERR